MANYGYCTSLMHRPEGFVPNGRGWKCRACGRTGLRIRHAHIRLPPAVLIGVRGERGKDRNIVVAHAMVSQIDGWRAKYRYRLNHGGYVYRQTWFRFPDGVRRRVNVFLHREILDLQPGNPLEGHHKDDDPLNCQRSNLEPLTRSQNEKEKYRRREGYQLPVELRTNGFSKALPRPSKLPEAN